MNSGFKNRFLKKSLLSILTLSIVASQSAQAMIAASKQPKSFVSVQLSQSLQEKRAQNASMPSLVLKQSALPSMAQSTGPALKATSTRFAHDDTQSKFHSYYTQSMSWSALLYAGLSLLGLANIWSDDDEPAVDCPKNYTVHLMWINKDCRPDDRYIFPSSKDSDKPQQFFDSIFGWASLHPTTTVVVWFDSAFTSQHAFDNTKARIERERTSASAPIVLKDIRQLSHVGAHPEIFVADMPVYFRVDLLRALIAEESLRQDKESCFVYADFDVAVLKKDALFNKGTMRNLHTHGYVMAKETNRLGFENSFQIFMHNEYVLKALQSVIINPNVGKAHFFLEEIKEKNDPNSLLSNPTVWAMQEIGFQENVYYSYPLMHVYLEQLKRLSADGHQESEIFASFCKEYPACNDDACNANFKISLTILDNLDKNPIPVKKVSIPPSTSGTITLKKIA